MSFVRCLALGGLCAASLASAQPLERLRLPPMQPIPAPSIDRSAPALSAPATLSVRAPYIDAATHIAFEGFRMVRPALNSAESMAGAKASTVIVAWEADPAKRYMVECELKFAMPNPEPVAVFKDVADGEKMVDVVANKAAFLTTPGRVGRVWVTGNGAFDFRSCTISPVG